MRRNVTHQWFRLSTLRQAPRTGAVTHMHLLSGMSAVRKIRPWKSIIRLSAVAIHNQRQAPDREISATRKSPPPGEHRPGKLDHHDELGQHARL